MRYYPVFIDLSDKDCLVVGAGEVGRRKIAALLERSPRSLLVVDTREPDDEMVEIVEHPAVTHETRTFDPSDLDGRFLVIASTSDEATNWRISNLCKERNILCNIVDQPEKCSFIVPAVFTQGDLTLAVSTGGSSPALAKKIRKELDEHFGAHYGHFLVFMSRLRPLVLDMGQGTAANTDLFREVVGSQLLDAMQQGDRARAEHILQNVLPPALSPRAGELLDGLV